MNVVICGCPRSRTTAIGEYLNADNRVFITHEMCNFIWEEPIFPERLRNLCCSDGLINLTNNKSIDINILKRLPQRYIQRDAGNFLISGDKCPDYIRYDHVCEILEYHPNTKFIIAIRNCHQFIRSSLYYYNDGRRYSWCANSIKDACDIWSMYNIHLLETVSKLRSNQYMIFKYETAVKDMSTTAEKINNLLGITLDVGDPSKIIYELDRPKTEYELTEEARKLMDIFYG